MEKNLKEKRESSDLLKLEEKELEEIQNSLEKIVLKKV